MVSIAFRKGRVRIKFATAYNVLTRLGSFGNTMSSRSFCGGKNSHTHWAKGSFRADTGICHDTSHKPTTTKPSFRLAHLRLAAARAAVLHATIRKPRPKNAKKPAAQLRAAGFYYQGKTKGYRA